MSTIWLKAGVHRLDPITEDTEIRSIASNPLDVVLMPLDPVDGPVLELRNASLSVHGCTLTGGTYAIQAHGEGGKHSIRTSNCQITHCRTMGIQAPPAFDMYIWRTLIEFCGSCPSKGHAIYSNGDLRVRGSILRYNQGYQIHHRAEGEQSVILEDSLITASRFHAAVHCRNAANLTMERCTYLGNVSNGNQAIPIDGTNLDIDATVMEEAFSMPFGHGIFWLADKELDGRGCYAFDPRVANRDDAMAHAEKLWDGKTMFNRKARIGWNHWYPPHWPGTPTPGLPGVGR